MKGLFTTCRFSYLLLPIQDLVRLISKLVDDLLELLDLFLAVLRSIVLGAADESVTEHDVHA